MALPMKRGKKTSQRKMDLSQDDVHVPGAAKVKPMGKRKGLHMRIHPDGGIEVRHSMAENDKGQAICFSESFDGETMATLPMVSLSIESA